MQESTPVPTTRRLVRIRHGVLSKALLVAYFAGVVLLGFKPSPRLRQVFPAGGYRGAVLEDQYLSCTPHHFLSSQLQGGASR